MGVFARREPPPTVVKTYGRWSFLGLISPLLAILYVGRLRAEGRVFSEDPAVIADMSEMARKGYRVVSMQQYELPMFGIDYRTVTYQRADRSDS
jgi:hypothetical protein